MTLITAKKKNRIVVQRWPQTDDELWWFVFATWGVKIPRYSVCPGHVAPFTAFANAYFARDNVAVWKASRGFGGKTNMLSILGMTELVALGAQVTILGGSGEQSQRVHETMKGAWLYDSSPSHMLLREPTKYNTDLDNGAHARTLMASQKSVRGPHPQRMRLDEIDEMELPVLEAAQGQPMRKKNKAGEWVETNTVMSSTQQYLDGTMKKMMDRAKEMKWGLYQWCVGPCTLVITDHGEKLVTEVTTNDRVWTRAGWKQVQHVTFMGHKKTIRISLSNGRTLDLTPDHKVLLADGSWIEAGRLTAGVGLVAGIANSATTLAIDGPENSDVSEFVTSDAGSFSSIDGGGVGTSKSVATMANGSQVDRIAASVDVAPMVEFGARVANPQSVSEPVNQLLSGTDIDFPVSPGVLALGPNPASIAVNDDSVKNVSPVIIHVTSVAPGYTQDVYDIGVEDQHEFTAEGIIVHNCYKESSNPKDGWLTPEEIERKRQEVSAAMFAAEYDLQEPSFEGRAIDEDAIEAMFSEKFGVVPGSVGKYIEVFPPKRNADYITGVDWAKSRDYTVIWTFDTTMMPWVTVAFERINRRPWPVMIERLNWRLKRYGGSVAHDTTGIGGVVEDYIVIPGGVREENINGIIMAGRARDDMLNNYISGIEQKLIKAPRIDWAYKQHKFATSEDLFGTGSSNHLPDSIAAGALAWSLRSEDQLIPVPAISIPRDDGSPWFGRI